MPQWVITALRLTGLGWFVAVCIVLGILGGLWLGNLTGQVALLVLVGTVLGQRGSILRGLPDDPPRGLRKQQSQPHRQPFPKTVS